MLLKLKFQS